MPPRPLHFLPALLLGSTAPVWAAPPAPVSVFLEKHCLECHDADVKKGGLDLSSLAFDPAKPNVFASWERVFDRVKKGDMPPAKQPRPEAVEARQFLTALEAPLMAADVADVAAQGRVRGRRLTRTEYEHTVHDLLGIDLPLKDMLPEDRASHGFETVADGQQLSHHQLGRYLDVADQALDEAFTRAAAGDKPFSRECTPEEMARAGRGNYRGPDLRDGKSISWPIGLQFTGRLPITTVPEDGWYRITLRGVHAINPVEGVVWGTLRSGECASSAPMLYMVGLIEATATPRDIDYEAWIQKGHMLELKPNDGTLKRAATGANGGNVSFKGRDLAAQGYSGIASSGVHLERIHPGSDIKALRHRLFGKDGMKAALAAPAATLDTQVAAFARRAFRRPVSQDHLAPYLALGREALAAGEPLPAALRASYRAILCSPRFLTLVEEPGKLDDHAVAARLSYAFWQSMPDEELSRLAETGALLKEPNLRAQVDRMLAHPRAKRFIEGFTDQWLKLKEIDFTNPDTKLYSDFDSVVQQSMLEETRAYFATQVRENLPVSTLVDSNFAFLNNRLARFYGFDGSPVVPGQGLQRVSLQGAQQRVRGGFIGQGAVHKVTADGTSTSPVVRGVFVNERLLGEHIPPPPPGIPAVEPDIRGATSIRDQLEKHRSNASCAACHNTIDPPGFVLENFNPVGQWRTSYGRKKSGAKVNPAGVTPDGEAFEDLASWKKIYTARADQLTRAFAAQFLTYATGAPIRFSDRPALEEIITVAARGDHGLRSILHAAVASPVFLKK